MKAVLTIALAAVATVSVPAATAQADDSRAVCAFRVSLELSPGHGLRPVAGTFRTRDGRAGWIQCAGFEDGEAFTGSGPLTATGDFGTGGLTRDRGDDCMLGSGALHIDAAISHLGLAEIENGNRPESLRLELSYARVGPAMTLTGAGEGVQSAGGVATWTPAGSSTCAFWVGDARSFRVEGRLLLEGVGDGSPAGAQTPPAGPEPADERCTRELTGTRSADRLRGSRGSDLIRGLQGADHIEGRGAGDCLLGGSGDDRIAGGEGPDAIAGGPGRDRLGGGAGADALDSRDGTRDAVDCGTGSDSVSADPVDRLRGCEVVALR